MRGLGWLQSGIFLPDAGWTRPSKFGGRSRSSRVGVHQTLNSFNQTPNGAAQSPILQPNTKTGWVCPQNWSATKHSFGLALSPKTELDPTQPTLPPTKHTVNSFNQTLNGAALSPIFQPNTKMGWLRPQKQKYNQTLDGLAPFLKTGLDPTQSTQPQPNTPYTHDSYITHGVQYMYIQLGGPERPSERVSWARGRRSRSEKQVTKALFSSQKMVKNGTVALSFLFDKHCPIIE